MKLFMVAGALISASLAFAAQESSTVSLTSLTEGKQEAVALQEILAQNKPVLIKFYSETCPPCKRLKPIFDKVAESLRTQVTFLEIETSQHRASADRFNIYANPTLIFWHNGKELERIIGAPSESRLRSKIKEFFKF
jgi:thioredoxin 1